MYYHVLQKNHYKKERRRLNARPASARGVSFALGFPLFVNIQLIGSNESSDLQNFSCIQICIQCIHDAELVMTQKLRLLRDRSVNNFDDTW